MGGLLCERATRGLGVKDHILQGTLTSKAANPVTQTLEDGDESPDEERRRPLRKLKGKEVVRDRQTLSNRPNMQNSPTGIITPESSSLSIVIVSFSAPLCAL